MKNRVGKFVKKDVPQAGSVGGEIYGNMRFNPDQYRKGMMIRAIRGGPGDALLNTDNPDPRLAQQQIIPVQKAALKDNATAVATAAVVPRAAAMGTRLMAIGGNKVLRDKATGKFVSTNAIKRFFRK